MMQLENVPVIGWLVRYFHRSCLAGVKTKEDEISRLRAELADIRLRHEKEVEDLLEEIGNLNQENETQKTEISRLQAANAKLSREKEELSMRFIGFGEIKRKAEAQSVLLMKFQLAFLFYEGVVTLRSILEKFETDKLPASALTRAQRWTAFLGTEGALRSDMRVAFSASDDSDAIGHCVSKYYDELSRPFHIKDTFGTAPGARTNIYVFNQVKFKDTWIPVARILSGRLSLLLDILADMDKIELKQTPQRYFSALK